MFGKSERTLMEIEKMFDRKFEENLDYAFANSFNSYLEKFRDMVDREKEIIEKSASIAIEELKRNSILLNEIEEMIKINKAFAKENDNLIDEIRKRDAIIERKNKQIAKLKAENDA